MENVKIYEIRNGISSNDPDLISPDKKHFFCSRHKLGECRANDKIYCIDRSNNEAFFTAVSGEEIVAEYNAALNRWEFKYNGRVFRAKQDDVFLKLNVFDQQPIPAAWKWSKVLGQNQIYDLWKHNISKPKERLVKINDLQRIFMAGPATDTLENCRQSLNLNSEELAVDVIPDDSVVDGTKLTLYKPRVQHPDKNVMAFNDPYRQFLMACKTKSFIILSGISGIGKSRLVRTVSYKTCSEKALQCVDKPGNFEMIRVKSDWHNVESIIGYSSSASGSLKYNGTTFIRFLVKAWHYVDVPFFLCLDEINLSAVDNYFSDYLSIIETLHSDNEQMYSDAFISKEEVLRYHTEDPLFWLELGLPGEHWLCAQFLTSGITLPPNLTIVGTANMNESTHAFSPRVLDRAMVIEMNKVDIRKGLELESNDWQYPQSYTGNSFLSGRLRNAAVAYHKNLKTGDEVLNELEEIYDCLDTPFQQGYRVRDQFLIYCAYNEELISEETEWKKWLSTCIDELIMMKILTRIEGNENKCGSIINNLLVIAGLKYPESYKKLKEMKRHLEISGYTSFWH